jgi:hypothetical protein
VIDHWWLLSVHRAYPTADVTEDHQDFRLSKPIFEPLVHQVYHVACVRKRMWMMVYVWRRVPACVSGVVMMRVMV